MSNLPKRTIEELLSCYENEPLIKDIFVEGENDNYIVNNYIKNYIKRYKLNNIFVNVCTISSIEIPSHILQQKNISNDNRGKIIYLIDRILKNHGKKYNALGIIDRDLDALIGINLEKSILFYTDYSCMEMYCFNEECISKIYSKLFAIVPNSKKTIHTLRTTLKELLLIRYANYKLNLSLSEMPFLKLCDIRNEDIIFDRNEYIKRYLGKNAKCNYFDKFNKCIEEARKRIKKDVKYYVNGDDFVSLFHWYTYKIKPVNSSRKIDAYAFENYIWLVIQIGCLGKYRLFRNIRKYLAN